MHMTKLAFLCATTLLFSACISGSDGGRGFAGGSDASDASSSGDSGGGDVGSAGDSGSDTAGNDATGADSGTDGSNSGTCTVDLSSEGTDAATVSFYDHITGPFTADDVSFETGRLVATVEARGNVGPMDSPVVSCDTSGGSFRVEAEGPEADGVDTTRFILGISTGYSGPGKYTATTAEGLEAEAAHSDVGGTTAGSETTCQFCMGENQRWGIYRCIGLTDTEGNKMHVLQGAFDCGS